MIRLIIDSTADLTAQEIEDLGVTVIPMKVCVDDKEYLAGVNLQNEEFFDLLKKCKTLPHTTQINQDEYQNAIKPFLDKGEDVFVMSLSSGLSGSFNSLRLASEELNSAHLEIFDTQNVTLGFKVLVFEALKLIKSGVSLHELKAKMEELKQKCRLIAVVDNVKYLIKGGRLSLVAGIAVTALNIKPIVTIKNGKVVVLSKGIGYNHAIKNLIKNLSNIDLEKSICIGHSNDLTRFEQFKKEIEKALNIKCEGCTGIGPIIGTHTGPGCVAIAYLEK